MTSETTSIEAVEIDESPSFAEGQVLHRMLQDGSGHDYFVYRPVGAGADAPIFVAIHDISRNAREQATFFAWSCDRHDAVLIAPSFAADRYPNYQRLGRSRQKHADGRRADATLEVILDEVASLSGMPMPPPRIHLFGYAAGGRFAMRFAMAHPDRVAGVVIAAPGAYTFPDRERRFPRGIGAVPDHPDLSLDPEHFLRVPMTVIRWPSPLRTVVAP